MNILFLCGSLEPGKDGVGDYTRRLAAALIRKGHDAQIIALCDKHSKTYVAQQQEIEKTLVPVYRIPQKTTYRERFKLSQGLVDDLQPNWVSLQYVPYSFHPKGLPFWLPRFLKKLKGNHQWHIMFHEVLTPGSNFFSKIIRLTQILLTKKMSNITRVSLINTSITPYSELLYKLGINSRILPLFSNIPISNSFSNHKINSEIITIGLFSKFKLNDPIRNTLMEIFSLVKKEGFKLKFLLIGGSIIDCNNFEHFCRLNYIDKLEVEKTGFLNEEEVSLKIRECDIGLSPVKSSILGKSGSALAFVEHGVKLVLPFINQKQTIDEDFFKHNIYSKIDSKLFLKYNNNKQRIDLLSKCSLNFLNQLNEFHEN